MEMLAYVGNVHRKGVPIGHGTESDRVEGESGKIV